MLNNGKLTFSNVCNRISKEKYGLTEAMDDIKLFTEIAGCFFSASATTAGTAAGTAVGAAVGATAPISAAIAGGVGVAALFSAISKKGKVLDGAKRIIELLSKKGPGYTDHYEHMQEAYALLCVSSFFDAYSNTIPKDILDKIELRVSEQGTLISAEDTPNEIKDRIDEPTICLPHIVYGCNKVYPMLIKLYSQMTDRLRCFIGGLAFSEDSDEKTKRTLTQKLNELPEASLETFKNQYLVLCSKFSDFYAYVNLEKEGEYANEADERFKKLVEMILCSNDIANQNFYALATAIASLPAYQRAQEAQAVTEHIRDKYIKTIQRTIVANDDDEVLLYPTVEDAFIPQRYRLLEYKSKETRLELEGTWKDLPEKDDMLAYWVKYILDPQSIEHIFLILGDPGGGKSLLMEMVSARISSDAELVIKVPLRHYSNINETDIESMLCKQITEDGDAAIRIDRLKQISGPNPSRPITLIFDGYDEVQQATGLAFRSFLIKLKNYQAHCKEEKRPVRIIVTSRRTLIDKADIPIGTTVMKLLDFDEEQKDKWIQIWNRCNHEQLEKEGLKDFRLPAGNKEIDDLSGQPLLLLMLAIYDADFENKANALQRNAADDPSNGLNRMRLYDELIRRFIRRELSKGKRGEGIPYKDANDQQRKEMISVEMDKLGVAAFGMFIRDKLFITVSELKNDIEKFKIDTLYYSSEGALDANEVFFGSFFFIHDSRTQVNKSEGAPYAAREIEKDSSFVFLHKTFYEFLVADFALSGLYKYAIDLADLKKRSPRHLTSHLTSFSQEFSQFYLSSSSSPFCWEPEIIKMIGEWSFQKLTSLLTDIVQDDVVDVLEDIIDSHVTLVKNGTMTSGKEMTLLPERPVPQQNAIYIINLVTLKSLIAGEWHTDAETWKFIAQFLKLNAPQFKENDQRAPLRHHGMDASEELLLRFMALFQIRDDKNAVVITPRKKSTISDDRTPLDAKAEVYTFLQDNITRSIYSLYSSKTLKSTKKASLRKIISFDKTLTIDNDILKLFEVLSNSLTNTRFPLYRMFFRFVEALEKGLSDTLRITVWMILYRQLIQTHLLRADYLRLRDYADLGTRILYRRLIIKSGKRTGDSIVIMKLWVDILKEFNLTSNIIDLFETALHSLNLEPVEWNDWILDVVEAIPFRCDEAYYSKYLWKYHNRYDNEFLYNNIIHLPEYFCIHQSPKVLASLFEAERKLGINNHDGKAHTDCKRIVDTLLYRHQSIKQKKTLDPFWEDIPYVLRELVIRGENDYVRNVLNKIDFVQKIISNPVILEYVSLADAVYAKDFLNSIIHIIVSKKEHSFLPYSFSAALRSAYSIIYHNYSDEIDTIGFLLADKEFVSYSTMIDPVQTAKLLCLAYRCEKQVLSDGTLYNITDLLAYYERILKHAPDTALELLSISNEVFHLNSSTVNSFINIARLEGYSEETARFFDRDNQPINQ